MKIKLFLVLILVFGLAVAPFHLFARSSEDELKKEIDRLTKKVSELQEKRKTLNGEIQYMDSQIKLTALRINETLGQINFLEAQIKDLSKRIGILDASLNEVSVLFINRVVATYKSGRVSFLDFLFSSRSFADFFQRAKYLQAVQANDRRTLLAMEEIRSNYDQQKIKKEEKQKELKGLKDKLAKQKADLDQQKESKKRLLLLTKNDEKKYQRLLVQAKTELNALRSFALSRGGKKLLPPQPSPDGWYYNQRDQRWGGALIGNSDMPVWEVGCLITSVAMLYTKNGVKTTPLEIASNPAYFFSDTAYMLRPWPIPSGFTLVDSSGNHFKFIDQEISQGRPVIVHLNIGGDGHFVVIKRKEGDEYIINDPWEGPDKKLGDYYSKSSIDRAASYRKN